MSNLLPEKARQRIRNGYRARLVMSGSALLIAAMVFTSLALFPSFAVLFITRPQAVEKASQVLQTKQDTVDVARAQSLVTQMYPLVQASSSVSSAIESALNDRPAGVHIDNIVYNSGAVATIALGGSADSRVSIDKYRTTLLANSRFTSVRLPVGDLVGLKGGRFTITLSGAF